jgi:hypothetical protein
MQAAQPINQLTNSVGFSYRAVAITQVDIDQGIAIGVDEQRVQVTLPLLLSRAKGRLPVAGESWLIDQSLGFWSLVAFNGKSADDYTVISGAPGGPRIELDPNGLRYYRADGGLLVDINTDTDVVRVNADFFTPFTLQNGWTNNTSPPAPIASYRKLPFDSVQVCGNLVHTGSSSNGVILATLPVGIRPGFNHTFPVYINTIPAVGGGTPNITVRADGGLQFFNFGTSTQVIFDFICPISA